MSTLVISLDFEMLWGRTTLADPLEYRRNVEGEWDAIPKILSLFRQHSIQATWATVGMLMCANHAQWRNFRPALLPGYADPSRSPYRMDALVREHPRLFFGQPLVERILATPGQELATHTYSHFYCGERGATPAQFAADLETARAIGDSYGVRYRSLVFPRNQVLKEYVRVAGDAGIRVYRGNQNHWLYRRGAEAPGGIAGRGVRFADSWAPLTGACVADVDDDGDLANVPASVFMRPWSSGLAAFEPLRLRRIKQSMTSAARAGGICHLWWHPHNFGVNIDRNLAALQNVIEHFIVLRDRFGMQSARMEEFAPASTVPDRQWLQ